MVNRIETHKQAKKSRRALLYKQACVSIKDGFSIQSFMNLLILEMSVHLCIPNCKLKTVGKQEQNGLYA